MCMRMKRKFDKYWKEYSVVLAFGAIIDPYLKFDFLNFCYTKLDPSTSEDKVKHVRAKFEKLYREYASNFNTPSVSQSQSSNEPSMLHKLSGEGSKPKRSKLFNEFKMFQNETKSNIGKSELDLDLDEPQVDYDDNDDFDVLNYWKMNEKRFPSLSIMARDVLSIAITTVASESAFSISGRVLTKYRSSTLPEHVQMLICTRNWLHGFVQNSDGTIMTISKDRVKASPLPDSWKLKEIFATVIVLGSYLALMTVIFFWAMKEIDFFLDKFKVRHLSHHEMMSALYLQISIVSQALIFVTRSRSWSYVERPGLLLVGAFIIAQLIATIIAVYANLGFAKVKGINKEEREAQPDPIVGEWITYLPALKFAREQGLHVTLHCGEVEICLTSNIRTLSVPSIDVHHFGRCFFLYLKLMIINIESMKELYVQL